jgi:L-fuculose-phosphate aldolase
MDEQTARREIVNIGRLLYERSYVVSSDGNVSVRLDDGRIVATPTMMCKGRMTEDALAITDASGKPLGDRRPSSELAMHLLIYQERPDVMAVCHAHPPHGTAFAVAGLAIDQPILSEVILTLGCVPLAAYGTPSTDELTEAMAPSLTDPICGKHLIGWRRLNTRRALRFSRACSAALRTCPRRQLKN